MNGEKKAEAFRAYYELKSDRESAWEQQLPKKYWDYRKQWESNPATLTYGSFPLHIGIENTSYCNLKCTFCIRTIEKAKNNWRPDINMDPSLMRKIIDEGAENGLFALNLNMVGEPLLRNDLPDVIKYAKERGILDVMFHTNATLLTKNKSQEIIKAGLDKIIFSIDGEGKETYEKFRIGSNYDIVFKNLNQFKNIRNELNSLTPRIRITMIRFKTTTKKQIKTFFDTWEDIADTISIQEFCEPQNNDPNGELTYRKNMDMNFICPQIWERLHIGADGTVIPCCMDYHFDLALGNVKDTPLKELWVCQKIQRIRELHARNEFYKIPTCAKCGLSRI